MQTSKSFFVICAAVLLAGASSLCARETEAQAKAREALHQKMKELDASQQIAPAPAPAAPQTPSAPPPAVTPPLPENPPLAQSAPAPTPPPTDTDAIARAREALRQKMLELNAQGTPAPTVPVTPAPRVTEPAVVVQPAPAPTPVAAPASAAPSADNETTTRTRAALRQKMAELQAQQPVSPPASPQPQWPRKEVDPFQTAPPAVSPTTGFKPLESPASPISGSKDGRLAELLRKYKADEITPEQYHKQRAAILVEP